MLSNTVIGEFFSLIGQVNIAIRNNTTYSGREGMTAAASQTNEFISDLFHNLGYIGEPMQAGDHHEVLQHIERHLKWFDEYGYSERSTLSAQGINIEQIINLFERMKAEVLEQAPELPVEPEEVLAEAS